MAGQTGNAAHICQVEDSDGFRVGGNGEVGGGGWGAKEADVCHFVIIAYQLLGQVQS